MNITFMNVCYAVVRIILEAFSKLIFAIKYYGSHSKILPPIKNLLLLEPASSLAFKIRTKKISSKEVVQSFIARILEVNPILNAVVDTKFDEALEEANKVDEYLKSCTLTEAELLMTKPFLGVPFTTKDCIKVKGFRQTAGLVLRKDFVSDSDADVVVLMKNAGAIILGVTNVSELCMWWESSNYIYGTTNNPYDTRRMVGGSSGGEGSILSAGGSPMGVGSDVGGSIRMPCFFNGIFGLKPTTGIVSNKGQEPVAVGEMMEFLVTGPMCRFSKDLNPMYKVLAASNVHLLSLDKKMKYLAIAFVALLVSANTASAYVYGRCEFAETLRWDYNFERDTLGDWVCLVQWESSYNTRATNINPNNSEDYGIYQINDGYWCYSSTNPTNNDCNVNCNNLIDDNIDDDVDCAILIQARQGFSAWYGWQNHCDGYDVESYVSDCNV